MDEIKIKKLDQWKNACSDPDTVGLLTYVAFNTQPDDLLIWSQIFFPVFIEFDNCVLWTEKYDENGYIEWMNRLENNRSEVEKVINHLHIYDLFEGLREEVDDEIYEKVAKILAYSWTLHLKSQFPEKHFVVGYSNEGKDYGPVVFAYQKQRI